MTRSERWNEIQIPPGATSIRFSQFTAGGGGNHGDQTFIVTIDTPAPGSSGGGGNQTAKKDGWVDLSIQGDPPPTAREVDLDGVTELRITLRGKTITILCDDLFAALAGSGSGTFR